MKRLDFIGVGPPKTGSTWIADNLRKHPDVFIPKIKEIQYFNKEQSFFWRGPNPNHSKSLNWYHSYFKKAPLNKLWGEISVRYFEAENCPKDIFEYNPEVKIIISLRNPIKKTVSQFKFGQQNGRFAADEKFENVVFDDDYLIPTSLYAEGVRRYLDCFPREQVLILFHDDLIENSRRYYQTITSFLGLADFYPDDLDEKSNATRVVRFKTLSNLVTSARSFILKYNLEWMVPLLRSIGVIGLFNWFQNKVNFKKGSVKTEIPAETKKRLLEIFTPDIMELEKLTGRDLSAWKK